MIVTGCASIVGGTEQSVMVKTAHVKGARCTLVNSKGSWTVYDTLAAVNVRRAYGPLKEACKK